MTTNRSSQIAIEPNAINVRVDQDFDNFIDNHSKFKNPQSVKILEKAMRENKK